MTPGDLLWEPTDAFVEGTAMARYLRWLSDERGLEFDSYHEAQAWSARDLEGFWSSVWAFFEVCADTSPGQVIGSRAMPGAEWFPGGRLSYAEHIFRGKSDDAVALVEASEVREHSEVTWGELRDEVGRCAAGLRDLGVVAGDRVAAYLPNVGEAVVGFLACASIGAVWSSASPDFGTRSLVDRFAQIEPKVLLAVDGYRYGGKDFDRRDVVAELMRQIPTLEQVVLVPYLGSGDLEGTSTWAELLCGQAEVSFTRLPFEHPLWILYSSGTTGVPKAIVHSQGGMLLEHLKLMHLHLDARAGDRVFWYTTTGWMMWNFLVGVLLTDAAIVLYDGNPGHPDLGVLWDLAAATATTCFGTSAAYIAGCMKADIDPAHGRDLSALRSVGSTGSPLTPEGFRWVYDRLGRHVWLFSTSGGTDVCTAFVGGVPVLPVYEGELQARALGAAIEAWDERGRPVIDEVGELVITQPMPSMPVCFWNDPDDERLRDAYFSTFPGVWRHGDWIEITSRGTAIITGRSDSTINRAGIRMGTSEIYRAALALDEVIDALVIDVPRDNEESWLPLFVVLRAGAELDDRLIADIARRIRIDCSPRHVPSDVVQVPEIPRTISGKPVEVPIKRILMGVPRDRAVSRDSLGNPSALDQLLEIAAHRLAK